jgi:glucans biosynthesis protein
VATRRDRGGIQAAHDGYRWVVDFEGPALSALPAESPPNAVASATAGAKLFDQHVYKNPVTGGWRFTFQLKPKTDDPVELRAYLTRGRDVLTETWSSVWLK